MTYANIYIKKKSNGEDFKILVVGVINFPPPFKLYYTHCPKTQVGMLVTLNLKPWQRCFRKTN